MIRPFTVIYLLCAHWALAGQSGVDSIGISSNSPICVADTLELEASGGDSYFWSGPNDFTSTNARISIVNTSSLNAGIYRLVRWKDGNLDTLTTEVIIHPRPVISLSGTTIICHGESIGLEALGPYEFRWKSTEGLVFTADGARITTGPLNQGFYGVELLARSDQMCTTDSQFSIRVQPVPDLEVTEVPDTVCVNSEFSVTVKSVQGLIYSGNSRILGLNGSITYKASVPGEKTLVFSSRNGNCKNEKVFRFIAVDSPPLVLPPDTTIKSGQSLMLEAISPGNVYWSEGESIECNSCKQTMVSPKFSGKYCVQSNIGGCITEGCVNVKVKDVCESRMPNIIARSSQRNNQICMPQLPCMQDATLTIFDRWGNIVFKSKGIESCWIPENKYGPQVFSYLIKGVDEEEEFFFHGDITILD